MDRSAEVQTIIQIMSKQDIQNKTFKSNMQKKRRTSGLTFTLPLLIRKKQRNVCLIKNIANNFTT